jgi:rhamnose utilization protein RhaD (predicted bifunctional aldolase and dehydrogenase)
VYQVCREQLATHSARWGSDLLLTQGAGGNTSLKSGDTLCIKASGKRLSEALVENIFVEMNQASLLEAITDHKEIDFNAEIAGPLRGSIETPLHAVIPAPVVVHLHSVRTLAFAIQKDGERLLEERFDGLSWAWVPYAKPGWPLTWELKKTLETSPCVWVLQNHGLIVASDSLESTHDLLCEVERRLDSKPLVSKTTPTLELSSWVTQQTEYRLAGQAHGHNLAFCGEVLHELTKGVVCPDQAVFLGKESAVVDSLREIPASPSSTATVVKGHGVLLDATAGQGADDLLSCLGLLACRVPSKANFSYLSDSQIDELLNWDAEKHRQALDMRR